MSEETEIEIKRSSREGALGRAETKEASKPVPRAERPNKPRMRIRGWRNREKPKRAEVMFNPSVGF